jgi:hypothetical protein
VECGDAMDEGKEEGDSNLNLGSEGLNSGWMRREF